MQYAVLPYLLLTSSLLAQAQFDDLAQSRHLPDEREETYAQALADFDGDGDLDLVSVHASGTRLYLNRGDATFEEATAGRLPTNYDATTLAVGDMDNDGDPDLVIRTRTGLRMLVNDGRGSFTTLGIWSAIGTGGSRVLKLHDLDRDGYLDILTLDEKSVHVERNDFAGRFVDVTPPELLDLKGPLEALGCGDVNGDGQVDIIVRGRVLHTLTQLSQVFLSSGGFAYTELKGGLITSGFVSSDLELLDLDGDGDLDLLEASARRAKVYQNAGDGTFTDVTAVVWPGAPYAADMSFVDYDRDGDLDVVVTTTTGIRVFDSSGSGKLTPSPIRFAGNAIEWNATLALGDLDGNGAFDVVATGVSHDSIWLNDGQGRMHAANDFANGLTWYSPARGSLGDLDGDGDLDFIWTDRVPNQVLLNRGDGQFQTSTKPFPSFPAAKVALGDLDNDGDLDAVLSTDQGIYLLDNQGDATFVDQSANRIGAPLSSLRWPLLCDLNGDGWLDIVGWSDSSRDSITVALNQGGRFPSVLSPITIASHAAMQVLDFDGDGDLDLVNSYGVLENDGLGNLSPAVPLRIPLVTGAVGSCVGDVDQNGLPDLFFAVSARTGGQHQDRLLFNFGGYFRDATLSHLPLRPTKRTRSATFVDIDQDGDLDLVIDYRTEIEIMLNDGQGHFAPSPIGRITSSVRGELSCSDLDSDGDVDIVIGKHIVENRLLHIETPKLARLGMPFAIDIEDHSSSSATAVPFVGSRLQNPIDLGPLGWLGVDPKDLITLPMVTLKGGRGRYEFLIPTNSNLVGLTLGIQALVANGQANAYRLTKTLSDEVTNR